MVINLEMQNLMLQKKKIKEYCVSVYTFTYKDCKQQNNKTSLLTDL